MTAKPVVHTGGAKKTGFAACRGSRDGAFERIVSYSAVPGPRVPAPQRGLSRPEPAAVLTAYGPRSGTSWSNTDVALPNRSTRSGVGPTDAALVLAARTGEQWAQEALYRRYTRMANAMAFRLMGSEPDADDLVQDAFAYALSSLERLDKPQSFGSWLGSILVRTAHKRIRRERLRRRLGLSQKEPIDPDALVSRSAAPDVAAEARTLYALVESLPADERIALVLRRVEGMTLPEIAKRSGRSLATVKRKLARAERKLAQHREKGAADD